MVSRGNGDVIISFMAYSEAALQDLNLIPQIPHLPIHPQVDRLNTIVAKLHLAANASGLHAWVDRHEVRRAQNCNGNVSAAKKNLGFFGVQGVTYVLDRIYPMRVDQTDLTSLEAAREQDIAKEHNHTYLDHLSLAALCMDAHAQSQPLHAHGPWHRCEGQLEDLFLHNGPHPVFIEEQGIFLGLGHLVRGETTFRSGYKLPDHYTHQYFAFSAEPPFELMALSPEFCFSSQQAPEDCESIQFASSLLRTGDSLLVGFGVQDCDSFVHQFDLHEVLRSLVPIQH
ncbi:unnamed protein product [Symbiodinium natans]|uniref:Uncharacterized protein n=1 Tax=Symbiodinium natans TaxID=878477 RepID=A0A812KFX9_9DINO|nr:unnamed protein product [Symbiodinium natans]